MLDGMTEGSVQILRNLEGMRAKSEEPRWLMVSEERSGP